jgi:hypothetical protein
MTLIGRPTRTRDEGGPMMRNRIPKGAFNLVVMVPVSFAPARAALAIMSL